MSSLSPVGCLGVGNRPIVDTESAGDNLFRSGGKVTLRATSPERDKMGKPAPSTTIARALDERGNVRFSMRVASEDRNHVTFTWGPIVGTIWKDETLVRAVYELRDIFVELAAAMPRGKAAVLTIIAANAPLPSADARTGLVNIFGESANAVVCSAVIMEGSGFRASAVRSVATGIGLIAHQPFPHRIFSNVSTALAWVKPELQRQIAMTINAAQFEADFELLRLR